MAEQTTCIFLRLCLSLSFQKSQTIRGPSVPGPSVRSGGRACRSPLLHSGRLFLWMSTRSQTACHCSSSHFWDPRGQRSSCCSLLLLKDFPGFKCNPQGVVKYTAVSAALERGSGISVSSEMITFIKGTLLLKERKKRDSKETTVVK